MQNLRIDTNYAYLNDPFANAKYCSLQEWEDQGYNKKLHWDYRGPGGVNSYNPAVPVGLNCHMYLPILQRTEVWKVKSAFKGELLNNPRPIYILKLW